MNQFTEKIKRGYDKIANIWYEKRDWYIEKKAITDIIAMLKRGVKILDVGCGSGKPIAKYLKDKGFDVYGIDISPKQLEYAKQIIAKDKLFNTDILNFSTSIKFEAIICWFTLFHIHISLHEEVLRKLHRLLKPQGLLLITFADTSFQPETPFNRIDDYTIESEMFGEYFYHSGLPAEINSQLVENNGFSILSDKIDQPGNQVILAKRLT
ncbi:class I SAM-dependent methyltransferase [Legionella gresilensis]|uniref:class I SAM-dependent methyltransferase n=1 Tax=Legionella gresilensis TaxID=91823 RepID=UPI0013EFACD2|nr:class I SAM-dependent methyltransferase [Legionella gresilensis]